MIGLLVHLFKIRTYGGESSESLSRISGVWTVSYETHTSIRDLVRLVISPAILNIQKLSRVSFLIEDEIGGDLAWDAMTKMSFWGIGLVWGQEQKMFVLTLQLVSSFLIVCPVVGLTRE